MSQPTPICVECRIEMRCEKNSQLVNDPKVGQFASTYWVGDVWKCPSCGHRIVTGFSKSGWTREDMIKMGRPVEESIEFRYE